MCDKGTLESFSPDLTGWLIDNAPEGSRWLLAHTQAGVVWGLLANGALTLAKDAFPDEPGVNVGLDVDRLQELRLFGEKGELHVWRTDAGFSYCCTIDQGGEDVIEDRQRLWGTVGRRGREDAAKGFTLLVEGRQGLRHAPPVTGLAPDQHVILKVRHYVGYDGDGQAYVARTRLMDLVRE